jgi:putative signal transducing protein
MRPVLKTNNVVLLNFAQSLLSDARIDALVLDENASIMDGSLGILPRRLMVADEDYPAAQRILRDGLGSSFQEKP